MRSPGEYTLGSLDIPHEEAANRLVRVETFVQLMSLEFSLRKQPFTFPDAVIHEIGVNVKAMKIPFWIGVVKNDDRYSVLVCGSVVEKAASNDICMCCFDVIFSSTFPWLDFEDVYYPSPSPDEECEKLLTREDYVKLKMVSTRFREVFQALIKDLRVHVAIMDAYLRDDVGVYFNATDKTDTSNIMDVGDGDDVWIYNDSKRIRKAFIAAMIQRSKR